MKRFLLIGLVATAAPALADIEHNGKVIDCYCTDRAGARVELGDTICMQVDGRMFMAQCQMSLNVPMWREVSEGCMTSSLRGGQSQKPVIDTGSIDAEI